MSQMDEAGKKRLLEEYAANKRPETREQLILEYAPLVKVTNLIASKK